MKSRNGTLAICIAFTVIGIALLFSDESRTTGLMAILVFGVGSLALATPLLTRRGPVTRTARPVDAGHERGMLFPLARKKLALAGLASLGIAGGCALIIAAGGVIVGALGVATFGGFALLALVGLFRERGLILTPTRIIVTGYGRSELAWEEVAGVELYGSGANGLIGIDALDPSQITRGWFSRFNRRFLPADLVVPADQLAGDPEELIRTLTAYAEHPERRAELARG